jgi:outer membrane protein insertion porin family
MGLGVRIIRGLGVACFVLAVTLLGAVPAVVPTGAAYAQTVSSIVVEGNRRVEANTIRSYFKPGPDGRVGAFQIDEAYKSLMATGLFQDVRIQTGGRIVVSVVENPVINRIAFEGNSRVKDDQLKLEIQSRERGTLSRPVVQSDVQRVVEVYRRSGRYDVRVNPVIIDLPNSRVDLVFEINEGGRTNIKSVDFVGNRAYSGFRLKEVIRTAESGLLSFLQSNNIYDPDRIEADRELLRRFYLKHGYIDVRVLPPAVEFDPGRNGFVIKFIVEEGDQFRVGTVDVRSNVRALDPSQVRSRLRVSPGEIFNTEAVEKTVEDMTIEAARQGFAFVQVRPRADRDSQSRTVNIAFAIEDGARVYIEQINIRGNIRTRDHVIRREFDVAEGDPYNRALIARAERRLKNLSYFKEVKITTEPGSAPDRVIINVNLEEQSTGEFSVAGGYSTADGFMGEVSIGERNLLGLGLYAKAAVQYGQHAQGYQLSFVEPYLLGYRVAWGLDLSQKIQKSTQFTSYETRTIGAATRFGFALREDLSLQLRYSIFQQKVTLPANLQNCNNINPDFANTFPTPNALNTTPGTTPPVGYTGTQFDCFADGEASLAVRRELTQGPVLTSLVGYDLSYNTLDNNRNPTSGLSATLRQDFAGVGGDVSYLRTTANVRSYYEVFPDVVGLLSLQGGIINGMGGKTAKAEGVDLRMLDHFQMGPQLVRGFAPSGIGPRDLTQFNFNGVPGDALGGSMYWGASLEFQSPIYFLPKDAGVKFAVFADAGSLWNYKGPLSWDKTGEFIQGAICPTNATLAQCPLDNGMHVRASVGAGILWASPFGPIRFDFAVPLMKEPYDRKQFFRFGGGTTF